MFSPGSQVPRAHDDKADGQEQKASRQVAVASGSTDPNVERRDILGVLTVHIARRSG
jgi:hypothetical protein